MKKILKFVGILLLIVVVIIGAVAAFIAIRGIPSYEVKVPEIPKVEITAERVARGEKIATMLCYSCHFNPETNKFTGRPLTEVPEFGELYSKNITRDIEKGIGKWTDAELIYFIRTGINPYTSKYVPPYMPKLMHISDEDLNSVIAFLHSDNPFVQPDKNEYPDCSPSFLTKFLCMVAFKPFPFPDHKIADPDTSNQIERGKYIVLYQLECFTCHSADFKKMDPFTPEKSFGFMGGGNMMRNNEGAMVTTLNLTPDEETGIGKWTEEDFMKAVKYGIVPNGGPGLRNPMRPYPQLNDEEVKAMYAYLRTIPKINHKVDRGI